MRYFLLATLLLHPLFAHSSEQENAPKYDDTEIELAIWILRSQLARSRIRLNQLNRYLSSIESEERNLRTKTSSVKSDIGTVESNTNTVRSNIRQVNYNIQNANSRLGTIDGEIAEFHRKTASLRSEISFHQSNEANSIAERKRHLDEQDKIKRDIAKNLQMIHRINAKIDLKEFENNSMSRLQDRFRSLERAILEIDQKRSKILEAESKAHKYHLSWLAELNQLVLEYRPNFEDVVDLGSYRDEYHKLLVFIRSAPSQSQANLAEDGLLKTNRSIYARLDSQQKLIQKIAAGPGLAIYKRTHGDDILDKLKTLDRSFETYFEAFYRLETSLFEKRSKRNYLVERIPILWSKLLKASLAKASSDVADEIILSVGNALLGNHYYAHINSILDDFDSRYDRHFNALFVPRFAFDIMIRGMGFVNSRLAMLESLPITVASREEIRAVLLQAQTNYQQRLDNLQAAIKNESEYRSEQIDQTNILLRRWSLDKSSYCYGLGQKVLNSENGSYEIERNFLEFRTQCRPQ
jgi:hypothetical protein